MMSGWDWLVGVHSSASLIDACYHIIRIISGQQFPSYTFHHNGMWQQSLFLAAQKSLIA